MGGKKRSKESSYEEVMKKIRKLEKKVKKKARLPYSSSDDETAQQQAAVTPDAMTSPPFDDMPIEIEHDNDEQPLGDISTQCENALEQIEDELEGTEADPETNQELLDLLGGDPSSEKTFDANVHKDIAKIWTHILLNGLAKDVRTDLLKQYLPPENCSSMRAPKLNLEIKAALTDINNKKDSYSQSKQNQLGSCLAALGKALNIALASGISQEMIKLLSDTGRLLCDYHHKESLSRRYAIINTLNKQTKDTIKNTKIDDYLFGADLADHIKSSKAISKSGMELRPPPPPPPAPPANRSRTNTRQTPIIQPPPARRGALNARGAGRAAAAAAEPRANPAPRRQPASAATTRDYSSRTATATRYQSNRRY